jgi:hypothetical protein
MVKDRKKKNKKSSSWQLKKEGTETVGIWGRIGLKIVKWIRIHHQPHGKV